jgi:Na+-translocating ferredoxin:NAD+ oxidoreductase subunit B
MPEPPILRQLQQHLDRQAVGFPAVRSGADLRILQRFFSPDEAQLALHLSFRPAPTQEIVQHAQHDFPEPQVRELLDRMLLKGAIGWKRKDGADTWFLLPMVVGMYEAQDGELTRDFSRDAHAYMRTPAFGRSFLSTSRPQMRTIPINQSIPVEHAVATYDHIRHIVAGAPGPFVALKCICRQGKALDGKPCAKTARLDTCLGMNHAAEMVLRRRHGRALSREETVALLQKNEDEGLVLQPGNAQKPDFVCSCCGCCCGLLSIQKMLPRPVDVWATNHFAAVDASRCTSCGKCVSRCQVNALKLTGKKKGIRIDRNRCIGCGLCVPACAAKALRLEKKEQQTVPPTDLEALYDDIMAHKKSPWAQRWMFVKLLLGMRQ